MVAGFGFKGAVWAQQEKLTAATESRVWALMARSEHSKQG